MEFFKTKSTISFMKIRYKTFCFSLAMIILSSLSLVFKGLPLSLDFTGGTQIEIEFLNQQSIDQVREQARSQFPSASIQAMGNHRQYLIRVPSTQESSIHGNIQTNLLKLWPEVNIKQVVSVGPQIGKDLVINGVNALVFALTATLIYIAFRFESKFALSAIIALMHDPIITLGIFSLAGIEFDIISLAGVLTVLGYSLNDTVVVYDRIREHASQHAQGSSEEKIVDMAINETLSRTIITSGLTLMSVMSLALFGGESLWGFSLTLIIGIIVGTYSSIYVAGALAVVLGLDLKAQQNQNNIIQFS